MCELWEEKKKMRNVHSKKEEKGEPCVVLFVLLCSWIRLGTNDCRTGWLDGRTNAQRKRTHRSECRSRALTTACLSISLLLQQLCVHFSIVFQFILHAGVHLVATSHSHSTANGAHEKRQWTSAYWRRTNAHNAQMRHSLVACVWFNVMKIVDARHQRKKRRTNYL